jgi:urease accessory protein
MNLRQLCRVAIAAPPFLLAAAPASAHHVMGGRTPSTFLEGLLSGLAHPVIGPEHLGFLIVGGVAIGAFGLSRALPAVFVLTMAAGVALHAGGVGLQATEVMVALSTALAGLLLACGGAFAQIGCAALFAVGGLLHGYAFSESIFGAESAPLGAYLLGLVIVQSALTIAIALVTHRLIARRGPELLAMAERLEVLGRHTAHFPSPVRPDCLSRRLGKGRRNLCGNAALQRHTWVFSPWVTHAELMPRLVGAAVLGIGFAALWS